MRLGIWLKQQRVTQMQFAETLGISRNYVSELGAGKKWPSREVAQRIREATRGMVSADDFLDIDGVG